MGYVVHAAKPESSLHNSEGDWLHSVPSFETNSVRMHEISKSDLGKDLQQLIIGQEVEAGEHHSFGLQVVLQALADALQDSIALLECFQQTCNQICTNTLLLTNNTAIC